MSVIDFKNKFFFIIEKSNSNYLGIYASLFLHLFILLFAIGLPDFFKPQPVILPNIIPIEIINVAETTSIPKKNIDITKEKPEKKVIKQKKFNSSENTEIKKIDIQEKPKIQKKEIPDTVIKKQVVIEEKKLQKKVEIDKKEIEQSNKFESLDTVKIKPKLKPKPEQSTSKKINTDVAKNPKPQPKRTPDFSIASMLKDLRNEKSNNVQEEKKEKEVNENLSSEKDKEKSESSELSISEVDLLIQQLTSCWIAPAGAVMSGNEKVVISVKVKRDKSIYAKSVRIVDTNIAKSNTFYEPITESAMRTFFNPECNPLKLPSDKYNLWKDLTITFDHSIMKGY